MEDFRETSLKEFDDKRKADAGLEKNDRPLEIFSNSYDHYSHGNHDIDQGLESIKVIKTKKVKKALGRQCEAGDWATVHYKSFNAREEKLEDTRNYKKGKPISFHMGYYQAPKCWEIALISLKAGESIKMRCPAFYAYGGEEKYSHFGSVKIPANSELIFEIDVLNCEETDKALDSANLADKNKADPIIPKKSAKVSKNDEATIEEEEKEIGKLKTAVKDQKTTIKKELEAVKKEESDIATSEADTETVKEDVDKLMKKEEKIITQKKVVDDEKTVIKQAEKAVDSAKKGEEEPEEEATDEPGAHMKSMPCFEIVYASEQEDGKDLVLEAAQKDKYAPKKTGVFNVNMQKSAAHLTKEEDEKTGNHKLAQQWSYDADKKALYSNMYPEKALFEGANKNLIIYNFKGLKNQQFVFDTGRKIWMNAVTNNTIELSKTSEAKAGGDVSTSKIRTENNSRQKWTVKACSDTKKSAAQVDKVAKAQVEERQEPV